MNPEASVDGQKSGFVDVMWTLLEKLDNFKINLEANDQKRERQAPKRFIEEVREWTVVLKGKRILMGNFVE
ncbi:MAG TPA: hypothetical protein VL346_03930 [Acidobacteriaceae bacterium]|nr:hypothetical protein [Acidobacteriaceae bacterium]